MPFPFVLATVALLQSSIYPAVYEQSGGKKTTIMLAEGEGKSRKLTTGDHPSISPDRKWVAFTETGWMEDYTGGAPTTRIEILNLATGDFQIPCVVDGKVKATTPVFSPNGKTLCFEVDSLKPNAEEPTTGIYTYVPDGKSEEKLVYKMPARGLSQAWPSWVENGKRILFCEQSDLVWLDPTTGKTERRPMRALIGPTGDDATISYIRFCPTDANRVLLTLAPIPGRPKNSQIDYGAIYAIDASGFRALTSQVVSRQPEWAPDGSGFYFYDQKQRFRHYDWATKQIKTIAGQ